MSLKQMSTNLDNRLIQKKLFCLNVQVKVFFLRLLQALVNSWPVLLTYEYITLINYDLRVMHQIVASL